MFKHSRTGLVFLAFLVILAIVLYPKPPLAQGAGAVALSGYAWSSNIGWIAMSGSNYGVTIGEDGHLSGYGWSSNIGWVDFNAVSNTNNKLTGFARALAASGFAGWDGKIAMSGSNYGVNVPALGGNFSGYAWGSDVVGWVSFSGVSIPTVEEPPPACDPATDPTCNPNGNPEDPDNPSPCDPLTDPTCSPENPDPDDPSYRAPTIALALNSSDRMEITSQPLTSPAISSPTSFNAGRGSSPHQVVIKSINSLNPAVTTDLRDNSHVTCRLSHEPIGASASGFVDCHNAILPLIAEIGTEALYLNIKVDRAEATVKNDNPYQVRVGIEGCAEASCNAAVIFDYRVGPVNPI